MIAPWYVEGGARSGDTGNEPARARGRIRLSPESFNPLRLFTFWVIELVMLLNRIGSLAVGANRIGVAGDLQMTRSEAFLALGGALRLEASDCHENECKAFLLIDRGR
jgi:hypothetical protein